MNNAERAFEVEEGFVVLEGAGVFSAATPPEFDAPIGSIYLQKDLPRKYLKIKAGAGFDAWRPLITTPEVANKTFVNQGMTYNKECVFVLLGTQNQIVIENKKRTLTLLNDGLTKLGRQVYVNKLNQIEVVNGI